MSVVPRERLWGASRSAHVSIAAGLTGFRLVWLVLVLPLFAASEGCGTSGAVRLASTTGRVTFNGGPVPDCRVTFTPLGSGASAGARSATALTRADGTFVLMTDGAPGAAVGEHFVFVGSEDANVPLPGEAPADLRFVVNGGENTCQIELVPR